MPANPDSSDQLASAHPSEMVVDAARVQPSADEAVGDESAVPPMTSGASVFVHWLLLLVCSLVILMSLLLKNPDDLQVTFLQTKLPELCTMKKYLSIGCPGCGMTRAFICISRGEFERAWYLNPASFMMYALVAFQIPYRILQLIRLKRGLLPIPDQWGAWYLIALAVLLIGQWILRLMFGSGW